MPEKPIQEQFGEALIDAITSFGRADLPDCAALEANEFAHVTEPDLRRALAQTFYGIRWLYKIGLALLVRNEEQAAHVRAQITDYASICEALISFCIAQSLLANRVRGESYKYDDPERRLRPIEWGDLSRLDFLLQKRSLWWLIRIAGEFGIVDAHLARELNWLRQERNAVHLRRLASIGRTAYLNRSKRAFGIVISTITQTKRWQAAA